MGYESFEKYQPAALFAIPLIAIGFLVLVVFPAFKIIRHLESEWDSAISVILGVGMAAGYHEVIRACFAEWSFLPLFNGALFEVIKLIIVIIAATHLRGWRLGLKNKNTVKPFFLSDEPLSDDEESDVLGVKNDAIDFANKLENNGSPNSLVFGIDAPWGYGKSSYLHFCKKRLEETGALVFSFEPLRYDQDHVLSAFLRQLSGFLDENNFVPQLGDYFARYAKAIEPYPKLFKLELASFIPDSLSDEDRVQAIREQLEIARRRLVIVIDDLDRLPIDEVKRFIDVIRVSLKLPYISFVTCFDTQNVNSFYHLTKTREHLQVSLGGSDQTEKTTQGKKPDNDHDPRLVKIERESIDTAQIREYFEKVVTVKQVLTINPEMLKKYLIDKLFEQTEEEGSSFTPTSKESMEKAIDEVFKPEIFYRYKDVLGDIRKIKRLVNTIRLRLLDLDVEQLDFEGYDLINLFLLHLNFSETFRDIYTAEINGKEHFSIKWKWESSKSSYENSAFFKEYLLKKTDAERFLLRNLFDAQLFSKKYKEDDFSVFSAAMNGTVHLDRSLERYLRLMTERVTQIKTQAKKFYVNEARKIGSGEKTMSDLASEEEFIFSVSNPAEYHFSLLLQAMVRNTDLFSKQTALATIHWFVESMRRFSTIEMDGLGTGLRDDISLRILYLLNQRGWQDQRDGYYHNDDTNVVQIAEALFEDGERKSVVSKVLDPENGVIGFYDGLKLRLHCSPYRGGNFYNLERGLRAYAKKIGETTDHEGKDTVRRITQLVYKEFKNRYVGQNKNFISDIYALSDQELFGDSLSYVRSEKKDISNEVQTEKIISASFIIYQLINNRITNSDLGSGLFDPDGINDNEGIRKEMQVYIFDV